PGRLFPITLQFRPPGNENQFSKENSTNKRINPMPVLRTLQLIDSKYKSSDRGDLLVFLSGMSEIQTRAKPLQNYAEESKKWIILALHSRLPQVHFIDEHRGDVGHHRRHPVCHRHRQDEGDELRGGDTDAQAARILGLKSECRTAKRTCW
ncbi:unnamed protein product, partial [Oikopleura dioica]